MLKHRYQTYADISTRPDKMTLITVYAGGNTAVYRSLPQFAAYKYYKLGPVNIKLIPASTLPVDPTGMAYEAGEQTVDPRDMLTPGLVRITNGEDFFNASDSSYDAQKSHGVFNAMMLDSRWFKWSLQKGISKTAVPRYWMIGQIRQDYYPGTVINVPTTVGATDEEALKTENFRTTTAMQLYRQEVDGRAVDGAFTWSRSNIISDGAGKPGGFSSGRGIFQTGQHGRLGWLPTDAQIFLGFNNYDQQGAQARVCPTLNNVPQVELFRIIMPPAYKTKFYYRMFVTETIYFKEPVVQNPEFYTMDSQQQIKAHFYRPLDRFIRMTGIDGQYPIEDIAPSTPVPPKIKNEGGNAKDNITGGDVHASDNSTG